MTVAMETATTNQRLNQACRAAYARLQGAFEAKLAENGYAPIYEDFAAGRDSLARLASLDFEVACFGHGRAIVGGAAEHFRQKWSKRA
jgi:hypothetical protein